MKPWLLFSLVAMLLWGSWGLCAKLGARSLSAQNLLLLGSLGSLMVFPVYMAIFCRNFKFVWQQADYYYAVVGGMIGALGGLFFYLAIAKGEASRVVTITALYPVITLVLALLFLREPLALSKVLWIVCAIGGIYILAR